MSGTPTIAEYVSVAAGWYHSVALKEDGSIVSWGYDSDEQVSATPTTADHIAVAAGVAHGWF